MLIPFTIFQNHSSFLLFHVNMRLRTVEAMARRTEPNRASPASNFLLKLFQFSYSGESVRFFFSTSNDSVASSCLFPYGTITDFAHDFKHHMQCAPVEVTAFHLSPKGSNNGNTQ